MKFVNKYSKRTKILGGITIASAISTGVSIFLDNRDSITPVNIAECVDASEDIVDI